jgi:uncharacterized membrane protein
LAACWTGILNSQELFSGFSSNAVIATVIHPKFEEIAILASIVVIRTLISYFLEKENEKFRISE